MAAVTRQGPIYLRITEKLTKALSPTALNLIDETSQHAGHAGSPGLPETHFKLEIVSSEFEGLSMVERHRKVYSILSAELRERVHALSLRTRTPDEASRV